MIRQKLFFTGDRDYDPWAEAVNGLISIARHQTELGNIEEAKRIASEVGEILDKAYENLERHWNICSRIAPTFMLFAWSK